jgi:hypothetical protein
MNKSGHYSAAQEINQRFNLFIPAKDCIPLPLRSWVQRSQIMFYPMFAMVLLTLVVAGILLFSRINAARSGSVDPRVFKLNQSKEIPDRLIQITNNYSNLFEIPILFYIACLLCMVWQFQNQLILGLAWLFVASRVVHTWIHLTRNKIIPRLFAFLTGVICVLLIWILLFMQLVSR